jgi:ABC-2 type transport system ATP-binding protein
LVVAKRPELLLLDEPVSSLDPLARRELLQSLMEIVAKDGVSVVLSSHQISDLERVCDYLVILVASHVCLSGEVSELLASHRRLSGPRREASTLPSDQEVIELFRGRNNSIYPDLAVIPMIGHRLTQPPAWRSA